MPKVRKEEEKINFRQRLQSLRNLPVFIKEVYQTSPALTVGNILLRAMRSVISLLVLYLGKLIIDEVIVLINTHATNYQHLILIILSEFGLVIISDILARGITLTDGLLGDMFANKTSIKLMEHAASLDLAQFEDATFYDKLERARQQVNGRTALLSQTFTQAQDLVTMGSLMVGLAAFNPWLILLLLVAVIPAFMGELYFNAKSYFLQRGWTPQRRTLDYFRYIGASDDTDFEHPIFSSFSINEGKAASDEDVPSTISSSSLIYFRNFNRLIL